MSSAGSKLQGKVAEMRRLFDESFARPAITNISEPGADVSDQGGGEPLALRVTETSGLIALKNRVLPVPSKFPELLGLVGRGGAIVPVYDLASLLGFASRPDELKWLLFCGVDEAVAFAFEELEHQFGAISEDICLLEGGRQSYFKESVRDGGCARNVIRLSKVVERIKGRRGK